MAGNVRIDWHPEAFISKIESGAADGVEEWARAPVITQCKEECPVGVYPSGSGMVGGTMRNSLTVVREDNVVHIGGGGPAKDYIYRQHEDLTLNHTTGKAKFIIDPVLQNMSDLPDYIKKHTQ